MLPATRPKQLYPVISTGGSSHWERSSYSPSSSTPLALALVSQFSRMWKWLYCNFSGTHAPMSEKASTVWCQRLLSGRCVNNCAAYTMYRVSGSPVKPGAYQSYVGGIIVLTGLVTHKYIAISVRTHTYERRHTNSVLKSEEDWVKGAGERRGSERATHGRVHIV